MTPVCWFSACLISACIDARPTAGGVAPHGGASPRDGVLAGKTQWGAAERLGRAAWPALQGRAHCSVRPPARGCRDHAQRGASRLASPPQAAARAAGCQPPKPPPPPPCAPRSFDVPNHRLKAWNEGVQRQLLQRPTEYLPGFQDAIRDYISGLDSTRALVNNTEVRRHAAAAAAAADAVAGAPARRARPRCPAHTRLPPAPPAKRRRPLPVPPPLPRGAQVHVGISGEFGELETSPRDLASGQLGRLVKVYGIVTKCSLVRPKLVKSVHYCPDTKVSVSREYRDVTALVGLPTGEAARRGPGGGAWRRAAQGAHAVHVRGHAVGGHVRAGSRVRGAGPKPRVLLAQQTPPPPAPPLPTAQARATRRATRRATCW